jgi:hypothetical protein
MSATAPTRNEREPQPVTTFAKEDGGSVKIDGAHVQKPSRDERGYFGPPKVVEAELKPAMMPGSLQMAVLWGGPADGVEARVRRTEADYRVPVPRPEGAGKVATAKSPSGKQDQVVVGGDYGQAVYRRTDQFDDGKPIFEFIGVE